MASFSEAFAAARKKQGAGGTFTWNGKSYSTDYKEETGGGKRPKARPAKMTAQSGAAQSGTAGKVKPAKATATASAASGASASSSSPPSGASRQKMKDIATKTQVAANIAKASAPKPPVQGPPKPSSTQKQKAGRAALKKSQAETLARAKKKAYKPKGK